MNICNGCVNTEACIFIDKCIGDVIATNKMHNTFKTLRDEFAIAAITGILVNAKGEYPNEVYAKSAYAVADAMLAVRENK